MCACGARPFGSLRPSVRRGSAAAAAPRSASTTPRRLSYLCVKCARGRLRRSARRTLRAALIATDDNSRRHAPLRARSLPQDADAHQSARDAHVRAQPLADAAAARGASGARQRTSAASCYGRGTQTAKEGARVVGVACGAPRRFPQQASEAGAVRVHQLRHTRAARAAVSTHAHAHVLHRNPRTRSLARSPKRSCCSHAPKQASKPAASRVRICAPAAPASSRTCTCRW